MGVKYTSLKLLSSGPRNFLGFTYDLKIKYKNGLYDRPTPFIENFIVKKGAFNLNGSSNIHSLPSGKYKMTLEFFIRFDGELVGIEKGKVSDIKGYGITKHNLKTTHGMTKPNRDNIVNVNVTREKKIILGIHSNVSPSAGFTDGHAWISYNNSYSIITYGLWPDDHPDVLDNGSGSDVRIGLEKPFYGQYNRYFLLTPAQVKRWKEYSTMHSKWTYTHTCASWASDAIKYVLKEDIDADDIAGFETPRELSLHIEKLEKENKTSPTSPVIVNKNNSHSF